MWCLVIYQTGETPKTFGNTSDRLLLVWNWQSKFFVNKFMLSLAYDNENMILMTIILSGIFYKFVVLL